VTPSDPESSDLVTRIRRMYGVGATIDGSAGRPSCKTSDSMFESYSDLHFAVANSHVVGDERMQSFNRAILINEWTRAVTEGSFITPKHHPNGATHSSSRFRSVFAPEALPWLDTGLSSATAAISALSNTDTRYPPVLYAMIPSMTCPLGSMIPPGSTIATATGDVLFIVWHPVSGWHGYVEHASDTAKYPFLGTC
jgi:hypothetical protein